ncbi:MAG: hypothetical protein AB1679_08345 [Actinomycetota bacterium]|jgi:hypothetical protein
MGSFGRAASAVMVAVSALTGWSYPAGAAAPPVPASPTSRLAGTWGACGSWWTETPTQMESGSVCGVDGVVAENGQTTQLAEPLISVTRYVCSKRRFESCQDESWTGTVRRSEMTVDPFLRRASIRGTLGGCVLDVEFAGLGQPRPEGSFWQSYGVSGSTPTISVGGNHTFTSRASWWGGVCGRTVSPGPAEQISAWMFRGGEANIAGFGGGGDGRCGCDGAACAMSSRPATAC